jgi:hypothetical protein
MATKTHWHYKAYDGNGRLLCAAGRVIEEFDGQFLVAAGSARLIAASVELLREGDYFDHWQFGKVQVGKINAKSIIVWTRDGERLKLPAGPA